MTFTTRPELAGTFGMVSTTHWIASAVGMSMLERGGNAFDAATAAGFVLNVVEPHLNGPLGDLVAMVWPGGVDAPTVLCGQGTAPAGATIAHYRAERLELVPGSGLLATVVPGAFEAWMLMLRDHGTMGLGDVLAPDGDGSLMMHVQEMETIRRHGLKVLICVLNDGAYGSEIHKLRHEGLPDDGAVFGRPDFASVARAFGIAGVRVTDLSVLPALVERFRQSDGGAVWDFPVSDQVVSPVIRTLHGRKGH